MPHKNTSQVDELLKNWEEIYKKGLLTFWILLFLYERPAYAYEMSTAITELSQGMVSADEKSMYRALNRFEALGILRSELERSDLGPQRRYYRLTDAGLALLRRFIERNILVFQSPAVAQRIQAVINKTAIPA
ncbi:MAG: PadR family transcriptional regulator [Chloroflexi bacterium]|nr:PadR family transcriptional regulator [Chloroflexota bacterium]